MRGWALFGTLDRMMTADLDPSVLEGADMFDVLGAEERAEVLRAGVVRKVRS